MKYFLRFLLISFILVSCYHGKGKYVSEWKDSPDGVWAGPSLWANRLQDWKVMDGKLVCINNKPMRTVHLTDRVITDAKGNINSSVNIFLNEGSEPADDAAAGFLFGAGNGMDYRAASLIHHSWGELGGLFIGLDSRSNLFLRDFEKEDSFIARNTNNDQAWTEVMLLLNISPSEDHYILKATAVNPATNKVVDRLLVDNLPAERVPGNIALVSHSGYDRSVSATYSFSEWKVSGSKIQYNPENIIGPVAGVEYTLSRGTMKMTVQFMPVGENENREVVLELGDGESWNKVQSARIKDYSYTAHFRIEDWKRTDDVNFRIGYEIERKAGHQYYQYGIIKHDPVEKDSLVMLSLSCIKQVAGRAIDAGYFNWKERSLYPHTTLTDNLKNFNADILYFAGDQVYEGSSPTAADTGPLANLDYLYKWILWCQTYKDLTSTIPSISIPDDHDVYHGNLWGAGGKATPPGLTGSAAQDAGGYKMPPEFVNMVQETQTSHLPDPVDPAPVEQGIGVYFTECNIGGLSIAIIEDRKFKSAPKALLPDADIFNGWPGNQQWNASKESRIDATLLGDRQLKFLDKWAGDWSNQTWMKAVVSQTLFVNLATIPEGDINDNRVQRIEIPDSGAYITTDRFVSDFDSDGWPQIGRDKALRLFRKAFATHIVGDQHLASTVQYGIDDYRDAGFAIVSPAVGNLWARRWHPPVEGKNRKDGWPGFLGDFDDGFGNKMTVFAVANPHKTKVEPVSNNQYSTGYSSITIHKTSRNIELYNWPYYSGPGNGSPFPFWPVKINQSDNYGKKASQWLPEIRVTGMDNPVIRIYRDVTGEMIYALRISGTSFQPKVFSFGSYTIEVGEPDTGKWQKLEGINATSFSERTALDVSF